MVDMFDRSYELDVPVCHVLEAALLHDPIKLQSVINDKCKMVANIEHKLGIWNR